MQDMNFQNSSNVGGRERGGILLKYSILSNNTVTKNLLTDKNVFFLIRVRITIVFPLSA